MTAAAEARAGAVASPAAKAQARNETARGVVWRSGSPSPEERASPMAGEET